MMQGESDGFEVEQRSWVFLGHTLFC